jgi:cohesin complex subunit SA-1/2
VTDALLSPDIALKSLIEDWVENYQSTAGDEVSESSSIQELVLFIIRCCGLSANIDEGEAVDADGVVDTLERIQDESVKVNHFFVILNEVLADGHQGHHGCVSPHFP